MYLGLLHWASKVTYPKGLWGVSGCNLYGFQLWYFLDTLYQTYEEYSNDVTELSRKNVQEKKPRERIWCRSSMYHQRSLSLDKEDSSTTVCFLLFTSLHNRTKNFDTSWGWTCLWSVTWQSKIIISKRNWLGTTKKNATQNP